MSTDAAKQSADMMKSFNLFREDMMRAEKSSKGLATNVTELIWQIKNGQHNLLEYLGQGAKLSHGMLTPLKEMAVALFHSKETLQDNVNEWKDLVRIATAAGGAETKEAELTLSLEEKRLSLHTQLTDITGKNIAAEFIFLRTAYEGIKRSGELNESLISANSVYDTRKDLVEQIYSIQSKTGASMQQMTAASKALASVWPKGRADFQSTLDMMIQMEQGLGVSYENSVQLARVFQISLKTPVQDVADQIAVISNSTSLAADEATRFAVETGKSLRLLGPGGASQVKEVTKYVTMLAGRMQDVGGDASEITKLFSEMTKGTAQGFMLRGLTGVTNPGALGTGAGSQAAFQGIDSMIHKLVTAGPASPAYLAQLENASQIIGISTESIVLWSDMMKKANEPLDEHAKLEQRWREQMQASNKSISQIKESLMALVQQGLAPILPSVNLFLGMVARFVSSIATNKIAVYSVFSAMLIGTTRTIFAFTRLTVTLLQVTAASLALSRAELLRRGVLSEAGIGGKILGGLSAVTENPIAKGLGGILKVLNRWLPAIGIAFAGGWAIGKLLDSLMNKLGTTWSYILFPYLKGLQAVATLLGKSIDTKNIATVRYGSADQTLTAWDLLAKVRRELVAGHEQAAEQLFKTNAYKVKGLLTEKGVQGLIDNFTSIETELRERAGLMTTVIPVEDQTRDAKKALELQRESVKRLGTAADLLKSTKEQDKCHAEAAAARAELDRMRADAGYRLIFLYDPSAPAKPTLSTEGDW